MERNKQKLQSVIHENLSLIIDEDLDNPIFDTVNITEVILNGDNSVADVYISSTQDGALEKLQQVTPMLRKQLAKRLSMKSMPELIFIEDTLLDDINELEDVLKEIN